MGDFTLGCLLGQYDKAQSFDVNSFALGGSGINSWETVSIVSSITFFDGVAHVHSSNQALQIEAFSHGSLQNLIRYNYAAENDVYA